MAFEVEIGRGRGNLFGLCCQADAQLNKTRLYTELHFIEDNCTDQQNSSVGFGGKKEPL